MTVQPIDEEKHRRPPVEAEALMVEEPHVRFSRSSVVAAIIGAAMLMQTLNATVLSNALPTMAHALHIEPLRLNLAITAYMLAAAVFLPVSGWLADRYGAKKVFLAAIALYAVTSALCGAAHNLEQLVAARLAQGMAGAMMMPVGRLVLLRTTPKNEIVQAMAVLTMPALLGPVLGPPIGGFIVTFGSWRWIFLINLPIAALGLFLVSRFVPNVKEEEPQKLDALGLILTGVGLAVLIFGFENLGRDELPAGLTAGLFLGAFAAFGLYWRHWRRNRRDAILDLSLFSIQTFRASVVGGGFMRIAMGATPFMLALLLQIGFGLSALEAGLLTFTSAVGALVMKTAAPPILRRFGFKNTLLVNAVIVGATFAAYALFTARTPHWLLILVLLTSGFFRSLQFTSLNGLAYADVDQPQMSRATTMASMCQQLVQSIGIGVAAMLIHVFMVTRGESQLTVAAISPAFVVIGAITLISILFFLPLPANAGDELQDRPRARRA
ncbi:MAG: MFS transporter [Caulobacteraceae bacterium]|nr:MFS transporter [Caulobacteraceae bacterium]